MKTLTRREFNALKRKQAERRRLAHARDDRRLQREQRRMFASLGLK